MRRLLLLALAVSALMTAAPAIAGEVYYTRTGPELEDPNVYAVDEATGATRVVLAGNEYTGSKPSRLSYRNHPVTNGQAIFHSVGVPNDFELIWRDIDGSLQ